MAKEIEPLGIERFPIRLVIMAKQTKTSLAQKRVSRKSKYPIAAAIDRFIHRVRDTSLSAHTFIPLAAQIRKQQSEKLGKEIEKIKVSLEHEPDDSILESKEIEKTYQTLRMAERISSSKLPQTVERSLFLGLFSAFDVFTGDLISAIYDKKPELFNSMGKTISVAEILKYSSINDLKKVILNDKIETFRRNSYVEQFKELESDFDIKLREFPHWPNFVECAQRRNILMHSDGIVSEQYLKVCQDEGYKIPSDLITGTQLKLGAEYFFSSCDLMIEIAVKLGQTLWRKVFPEELEDAESHLTKVIYDCLEREKWKLTLILGEFSINQKKSGKEINKRIDIINYSIALKYSEQKDKVRSFLSKYDWSSQVNDLKLAEAVMLEDYDKAAEVMIKIGKQGELVTRTGYHIWPLFREFRATKQFAQAYQKVYDVPFITDLKEATNSVQTQLAEGMQKDIEGNKFSQTDNSLT